MMLNLIKITFSGVGIQKLCTYGLGFKLQAFSRSPPFTLCPLPPLNSNLLNKSYPLTQSTYSDPSLNQLNLNFSFPKQFLFKTNYRTFSTSVSKEETVPSFRNERKQKFYSPYMFEEVTAPTGGGPLYWKTRKFLMNLKRRLLLRARERRWNWDIGRASFAGVPKLSYDPKLNQWVTLMDNEEWGGLGGRFWIQFSNVVLFNFLLAFLLYFSWYRLVANNKHNVFARWMNRDEDDE
ncbi:putative integral membrane protein [Theileria parva strain Muguga]|uniref:Transmembrane protein n=1 Tax=Theileria parva TaxID=5875 RepID=Q4MZB9_THEPA|nr:putative integral membrane protein [Theileria parva strain Muguga]EAN31355.1 putative integral membrane protein [Theileria parva strain Muguga]|eukprot:XP_763638.1 hypothetical protein [Theileria parva strain Muguga]